MVSSSEFIKGYTEIIVCALLYDGDDYIYNIVKRIVGSGGGEVQITNPSLLMIMKKMLSEGKITSYMAESKTSVARRYYSLTPFGRSYFEATRQDYLDSLNTLKILISGGKTHESED